MEQWRTLPLIAILLNPCSGWLQATQTNRGKALGKRNVIGLPRIHKLEHSTFHQAALSPAVLFIQQDDENDTSIDEIVDRQFFDPDSYDETDESFLGKLAQFVKSDYELAETLYVGIIFVMLVIVSQELLRFQMYGDGYVPFKSGSMSGRLY